MAHAKCIMNRNSINFLIKLVMNPGCLYLVNSLRLSKKNSAHQKIVYLTLQEVSLVHIASTRMLRHMKHSEEWQ